MYFKVRSRKFATQIMCGFHQKEMRNSSFSASAMAFYSARERKVKRNRWKKRQGVREIASYSKRKKSRKVKVKRGREKGTEVKRKRDRGKGSEGDFHVVSFLAPRLASSC